MKSNHKIHVALMVGVALVGAAIPLVCTPPLALAQTATGYVRVQNEGTNLPRRSILNFIGASVTCTDVAADSTTECQVDAPSFFWTAPTLLNSWVDYDTTNFAATGWTEDHQNFVHLRGLLKDGTATSGTVLFALPSGARPAKRLLFPCVSATTPGTTWANCRVDVNPDGNVTIVNGGNVFLSLDGIEFEADGS